MGRWLDRVQNGRTAHTLGAHPADYSGENGETGYLRQEAEAAYRAAWNRWWNALYERAGAMLAEDADRLAELEPEYEAARDAYFAAGDALEALDPGCWDRP
jgi:hypothetical protein